MSHLPESLAGLCQILRSQDFMTLKFPHRGPNSTEKNQYCITMKGLGLLIKWEAKGKSNYPMEGLGNMEYSKCPYLQWFFTECIGLGQKL